MGAGRTNQAAEDDSIESPPESLSLAIIGTIVGEYSSRHLFLDADQLTAEEQRSLQQILRRATTRQSEAAVDFDRLTAREREISALVCEGLGNLAIAERLSISEATVRHHLTSIFSKLGVRDRVALVIAAFSRRGASAST